MNQLTELMTELKLTGMKETLEYRLEEASHDGLDYPNFLSLILEDEKIYRKNRKSERLRKRARFNNFVSLDEFELTPERKMTKAMIKKLGSLSYIDRSENLIFTGGTGAGKSYLAQSVGQLSCLYGIETLFFPVNSMFKEIQAAEVAGDYVKYMNKFRRCKVIIFDDFGLRNYTHEEATILYDICEQKYQKGTIIVTSQVKPLGWKSLFEDDVVAEAIVDRLTSCAHHIHISGPSYREKHRPKDNIANSKKVA